MCGRCCRFTLQVGRERGRVEVNAKSAAAGRLLNEDRTIPRRGKCVRSHAKSGVACC